MDYLLSRSLASITAFIRSYRSYHQYKKYITIIIKQTIIGHSILITILELSLSQIKKTIAQSINIIIPPPPF